MNISKFMEKHKNFGIKNLMTVIIFANVLVFILFLFSGENLSLALALIPSKVLEGEVWRLFSYVFIPTSFNPIFFLFATFLYYIIGRELENYWGTLKFNIYYLMGVILTSIVSMAFDFPIAGVSDLNMSLFLAYAALNPEHTVYLYMIIPIKMKYMAIVTLTILGYRFLNVPFLQMKLIILAPFVNFLIFFLPQFIKSSRSTTKSRKRRKEFESKVINFDKTLVSRHRCVLCNKTEKDDENLEFRICSKCQGIQEYCSEHIFDHKHI